jgi:arylsulfate sulfotransferase
MVDASFVVFRSAVMALRAAGVMSLALVVLLAGCGNITLRSTSAGPPAGGPPKPVQGGTVTITPQYVALAPGQSFHFAATVSGGGGAVTWSVSAGSAAIGTAGSIDSTGDYTAPASIAQSQNVIVTAALAASPQQNYASAVVSIIQPGQTLCPAQTKNPQVALYSIYLPAPGKVSVEFGKTSDYGLSTWQVATPSANGGEVKIFEAGMLGNAKYHMRGQVTLDDGATLNDADQTCTTGAPPKSSVVQVTTPGGGTPQPGIEMWNTLVPRNVNQVFATDLNGNVIWTYANQGTGQDSIQGIKLLPNGDFLMVLSYLSSLPAAPSPGTINSIREIDLAGDTVREITMDALNQKLATSNLRDAQGNAYQLKSFHHNVLALPNRHWILLATATRTYNNLPGSTGSIAVLGDVLVDVDENSNPDWAWNTFDNLDIQRRPMSFPDWTHSNDMLYSSDDHNLLLSMRHQNWIIKIEFLDGKGSGKVMWRLGEGGDFKLVGGADPTDWFYAQHGMNYFTPNTTGVFRMGLLDNGNDRIFPTGQELCKPTDPPSANCYTTAPLLEINEADLTATLVSHYSPGQSYFSFFGGNVEQLGNDDMEINFCAPVSGAIVQELDAGSHVVWQATTPGADQFHVNRLPSLYPGVQW